MSTQPVFSCKYCGKGVIVTTLETAFPDPEGEALFEMMANLKKIAICPDCLGKYNWYASQGRTQDFLMGRP
jgi:hypothetical protein